LQRLHLLELLKILGTNSAAQKRAPRGVEARAVPEPGRA
jgi:hypothetical protein